MRKHLAHRLAGMGVGGERGDLGIRMPREQPHGVGAGVAGGAEHGDFLFHAHGVSPSSAAAANACGRISRMSPAICCEPASPCAASALAIAA